jgi:hypothetical protein
MIIADHADGQCGPSAPAGSRLWPYYSALLVGLLIVLTAAALAVAVSIWSDRQQTISDGVKDAKNLSIVIAGQIEHSLQAVDMRLRGLQRRIDEVDDSASLSGIRSEQFYHLLMERL